MEEFEEVETDNLLTGMSNLNSQTIRMTDDIELKKKIAKMGRYIEELMFRDVS